ncbi:tripartite tricarboxylate transporter TctB family protein [Granulosicoccus sp. 3-233]|uniref:tripartite tricarboxylate transporter TctB family protein n=1 Tax=Granulosicoccus sp. 3-233 TaxID=3417969 RepID=UPI003D32CC89
MTGNKVSRWKGMGVPVALLLMTLIYGSEALTIKSQFDEGLVGPSFLPLLLTAVVVLGLLGILVRQWRESSSVEPVEHDIAAGGMGFEQHRKPALVALSVLAYVLLFKPLGYVLATVSLAFLLLKLFDYAPRQWLRQMIVSALMTLVFHVLFSVCFSVRLPLLPSVFS